MRNEAALTIYLGICHGILWKEKIDWRLGPIGNSDGDRPFFETVRSRCCCSPRFRSSHHVLLNSRTANLA